jgi:hypothetical protein
VVPIQIAEAFIELRVKSDKAKTEARDQARATAQEVTKTFAQYFSAAVVVRELGKITSAAANLEQAVGGTEAIFGKASATINRYAADSAKAMGLSERAFREVTSQIGGLLSGLGFTQDEAANTSVKLAQLGADLAATFGGRPEEAVQALGAALRGEFDPLERFGVSLRQSSINLKAVELGLAESTSKVDDNARAQAALALITEQSANAVGQFEREQDTASGKAATFTASLEDQRAKIGAELLPIFAQAIELLGVLVEGFAALPAPIQTATIAIVGVAALAGPVGSAVSALGALKTAIPAALGNPAVLATLAVAGLAGALFYASRETDTLTKKLEAARERVEGLREQLAGFESPLGLAVAQFRDLAAENDVLRDALVRSGITFDELGSRAVEGGQRFKSLTNDVLRTAREMGATDDEVDALRQTMLLLSYDLTQLVEIEGDLNVATKQTTESTEELTDAEKEAAEQTAANASALRNAALALRDVEVNQSRVRDEWEQAADAADALGQAIDKVFGAYLDVDAAADNVRDGVAELTATLEENEATLDANTEAGRANRAAVRDQVSAILDYATAGLRAGDTTQQAADKVTFLTAQLRNQLIQAGLTEAQVDEYLATLGLTPENVTTSIELANEQIARENVQSHLDSLDKVPAEVQTEIQALIDAGEYAEAERRLDLLGRTRYVNYRVNAGGGAGGKFNSADGRFVAGGTNMISSLGEMPGRAGDELVLPLGRPSRIAALLADPRVGDRVAAAMPGASGGSTTLNFYPRGDVTVDDVNRALTMARLAR